MNVTLTRGDVERFRDIVSRRIGLWFEESKLDQLEKVLRARVRSRSGSVADYFANVDAREVGAIAEHLTVGETFFFRYREHFEALSEDVVPELARHGRLRILSIGCASGDEPYSIAIELREKNPERAFEIVAFDVNPASVERARRASYPAWALRETSPERRRRYFVERSGGFDLADDARAGIVFEVRNVVRDDPAFWRPSAFDLVFCRNVIMYFAPATMREVVGRIARSLRPGGYLFLGHAETLRGVSEDFELCQSRGTFYHRRKASSASLPVDVVAWPDAIRDAAVRIATLTDRVGGAPAAPALDEAGLEESVERALRFTNAGNVTDAERECRSILASGKDDTRVHYLLALCREHAGDNDGALAQDRLATKIDPDFVMPLLHAGLLERRAGRFEQAEAALTRALDRLANESAARLAAFAGGFGRESLVLLCRQAIARCKESK